MQSSKKILVIKNITHEGLGLMGEVLGEYGIVYDIVDPSKCLIMPDLENYSLIIIMGGPDSANDGSDKIITVINFIKNAFQKKIPVFGVCLGMQLIGKISGARVYESPVKEIGFKHDKNAWYEVTLTPEGVIDPLFKGLPKRFKVFQLHGETIELEPNLKLLGTGKYCTNQIIKVGFNNYGIQYHFELTEQMFDEWLIKAPELTEVDKDTLREEYEVVKSEMKTIGKKFFKNLLRTTGFF